MVTASRLRRVGYRFALIGLLAGFPFSSTQFVSAQQAWSLPAPWSAQDIGNPAVAGSASFDQGTFTINAGGADIWGQADQFTFVYQQVTGDVDVVARVDSVTMANVWSKAGVMIRSSLAANAAHGFALVSAGKGTAFQRRLQDGGYSSNSYGPSVPAPRWVRLVRAGSRVTAYSSADGVAWATISSSTIALGSTAYVGIATTSHNVSAATTAAVAQVSIVPLGLPSLQQATDIGSPSVQGSTSYRTGTYTVRAGGADIWGSSDQFHFVYQQMSGDVEVIAHVQSLSLSNQWAKTGVMIRESLAADSRHGFAMVSGGAGYGFQRRIDNGGISQHTAGPAGKAPGWVRLVRTGSRIEAFQSSDGTAWTSVGADAIPMNDTVYVGIATTSHSASTATTAVLDSLSIKALGSTSNQPPQVSITSPTDGSTFTAGGDIAITAGASDSDGTIARVNFLRGTTVIGSATAAPYSVTWSSAPAGTYSLTAVAVDSDGASTTSSAVSVKVDPSTNQPPSVTLTGPANGASYTAPATIALTATASDPENALARVDFYQGATLVGTDASAPYSFTWSSVGPGTYALRAVAYDDGGVSGSSATATVTVAGANQPPSVTLTGPANGASFTTPATIAMAANASDPENALNRVEFYSGTTLLGSDSSVPFAFTWSSVAAGTYSLRAVAYDNSGGTASSATATVTVGVAQNQPPTVSMTAPADGSAYSAPATISLSATANDADGTIAKVEFYAGTTLLATDTTSPYSYSWSGANAGTYSLTALAYDATGANTRSAPRNITVTVTSPSTIPAPWTAGDIGNPALAGSSTYANSVFSVDVGGVDIWNTADQFHFIYQPVSGDTEIVARVDSVTVADEYTNAGVMIRGDLTAGSMHGYSALTGSHGVYFRRRVTAGATTTSIQGAATQAAPVWMRLARQGQVVTSYWSTDGVSWTTLGSQTLALGTTAYVGLAVSSHNATARTSAQFSNVRVGPPAANRTPTVTLTAPPNGSTFAAPATVSLTATASDSDGTIAKVEFYAGTTLLSTDTAAPYTFSWTSVAAGTYALKAIAYDNTGASASSATSTITVSQSTTPAPTAIAFTASTDHATLVTSYELRIYASGANPNTATPLATSDLGKPTPDANNDITVDRVSFFSALASGNYVAAVAAIGSGGTTLSTGVAFSR